MTVAGSPILRQFWLTHVQWEVHPSGELRVTDLMLGSKTNARVPNPADAIAGQRLDPASQAPGDIAERCKRHSAE